MIREMKSQHWFVYLFILQIFRKSTRTNQNKSEK